MRRPIDTEVPPLDDSGKLSLQTQAMRRAEELHLQWQRNKDGDRMDVASMVVYGADGGFGMIALRAIYLCRLLSPADQLTLATLIERCSS